MSLDCVQLLQITTPCCNNNGRQLTHIQSDQGNISKVSVWGTLDHLEAAKLGVGWKVIIIKHLHSMIQSPLPHQHMRQHTHDPTEEA